MLEHSHSHSHLCPPSLAHPTPAHSPKGDFNLMACQFSLPALNVLELIKATVCACAGVGVGEGMLSV